MLISLDIETFARALEEAEHLTPPLAAAAAQQQEPAPSNAEGSQTPSKSTQAPNPAPGDKGQSNDKAKAPEKMDES